MKYLNWQIILACIYLLNVGAMIFFKLDIIRIIDISFLSRNFLTNNLESANRIIFELPVQILIFISLGLLCLYHLYYGLRLTKYSQVLKRGYNQQRCLVFGLSLALILVSTALILGISELSYLVVLLIVSLIASALGLINEYLATHKQASLVKIFKENPVCRRSPVKLIFILQKLSYLGVWLLLGISLLMSYLWADLTNFWLWGSIYLVGLLFYIVILIFNYLNLKSYRLFKQYSNFEGLQGLSLVIFITVWLWLIIGFI